MPRVDTRRLPIDEPHGECCRLFFFRQLEPHDCPSVGKTGLVVDVGLVTGARLVDHLQHAAVEVGLLHVGHAVGRGAVPAVADRSGEVAVFLAIERVFKDERARLQPGGVVAGMADAFKLSGILGVAMGLYCLLALPSTPPQPGRQKSAIREAIQQVRLAPLVTLFMLAVPVSCIHQFYFVHTSGFVGGLQGDTQDGFSKVVNSIFGVGGGGLMTIGQMSEIAVLAFIPVLAATYSRKTLLAIGLAAYAARMFLFAYGPGMAAGAGMSPLAFVIPGVALHGLCFGCFIFVAFMIVDEETSGDVRASAQSLFNLVIIGIGIIVGSKIASAVSDITKVDGVQDFKAMFSVPMWGALFCLVMLLMFYLPKSPRKATAAN
jgi:hypothetical protein